MSMHNNWGPGNGTGTDTYMDIDTGDITVVTDNGGGYHSVFHIKNKK